MLKRKLCTGNIPPYLGVYNSLYSDIINGVYKPNDNLPSEVILSEKYGVSRNTLRQALAILNEDGLIIKSQGKGTIVTSQPAVNTDEIITNPLVSLCKKNITESEISFNYGSPTDIARTKLSLDYSDIVLASNCIYKSNNIIMGYSFTQIPTKFFSDLNVDTSSEASIKELITDMIFQSALKSSIHIKLIYANELEIEFLKVPLKTPLFLIEALLYNQDLKAFARCKYYFIPEYYHLQFII
ncbi:MAG: GntR family transcriptional regulator [Terrisporobacter sp.]|uniref:GntR family transcriptional regulator n=1 Tax=Terrisporobacter sp. TaxID=1965305 RepID=UPI002FCA3E61